MARDFRSSLVLRFIEFITLYWVSATGRLVIQLFIGNRIALPRTGLVDNDIFERNVGILRRLWALARSLAYDQMYFLIGFVFWSCVLIGAALIWVHFFGAIPPIHEWRR